MRCPICRTGETDPGTGTFSYDKNGSLVVIRQVPAEVCSQCGAPYYSEDTVVIVQDLVKRATDSKLEIAILSYADWIVS